MFLTRCEKIGREVLIWTSDVHSIDNTEQGIILRYRCTCGEMAEMLTGSGSPVRVNVHVGMGA